MATSPDTPRRRVRNPTRLRGGEDTAPPNKKLKYVPGGPGGGGRYLDPDTGNETPVGGTGPGGYNYIGSRGRIGRSNTEKAGVILTSDIPTASAVRPRPRRERTQRDRDRDRARRERERQVRLAQQQEQLAHGPRSSSASAAAAAVAQNDGYKPREERGWEEFHPDLDLDVVFPVYTAEEVDGLITPISKPGTPIKAPNFGHNSLNEDGANGAVDVALMSLSKSPTLHQEALHNDADAQYQAGKNGTPGTPHKRRPGRPARRADYMLTGLGSPPAPRIIPIPAQNPKERLNLPKPVYRQVETFATYEQDPAAQVNYVDKSMAHVGYQESEIFARPERTFIRVSEGSIEDDLDLAVTTKSDIDGPTAQVGRVEYDMDEQDERWLEAHNMTRRKEEAENIKPWLFEITMTQIEKEWHSLEKRIPKPNPKPPQTHRPRSSSAAAVNGEIAGQGEEQDSKCAICDDGDCENTNAIVFCDGCDLAVHQECYGVPFIPEGQWLCRKCQLIGRATPTCIFCPNVDGAFKQTNNMRWSHLLCAIWIPEVSLGNTTFMEPVMDVEKVQKQRWKLQCYICQQKMGACIQCGNKNCYAAFHVTCARRARLYLKMKSAHSTGIQDASVLKAFCHRHVTSEWRRDNDVEWAYEEAVAFYRREMRGRRWADSQAAALAQGPSRTQQHNDGADEPETGQNKKRGVPQKQVWRLPSGAPVVPQVVFNNVETALQRFNPRRRKEFVAEACKYWTLKREARRGASLLKRLQLQMEQFSSMEITRRNFAGMGAAGGPRLQRRIEFAEALEKDMAHLVPMVKAVKEREDKNLFDARLQLELVDLITFPIQPLLEPILAKAQQMDGKDMFADGLNQIRENMDRRHYVTVADFTPDLANVFRTALNPGADGPLTLEEKQRKAVAKRIIKAIQGPLDDVTRKESDIVRNRKDFPDLAALIAMTRPPEVQQAAREVAVEVNNDAADMDIDSEGEEMEVDQIINEAAHEPKGVRGSEHGILANGISKNHANGHMHDPDAEHDETTDEAVIRLQLGETEETIPTPNNNIAAEQHLDTIMAGGDPAASTGSDGSVPSLSASGSTHPSTSTGPPTHAHGSSHNKTDAEPDDLRILTHGGIPWYAAPFSPSGTTLYMPEDEPPSPSTHAADASSLAVPHAQPKREASVLSSVLSDLSELGEDEIKNLGPDGDDSDGGDGDDGDEDADEEVDEDAAALAAKEAAKKRARTRRRRRGYR
ncbi:hypothetical protein EJ05DRAFT_477655 [Pseudovirgaria hyperparasitica]|uniref:PHD finger domain-containing protein n=1 Tax=Pseudovirgaria hyperparasitica TaxID=470096 RepID=A0A6A6W0V8_9PEZI|nr:uncharacterized protein EJ05DRAFT_477655 [Pseudovirgaria hyperparasitica]KAF2756532.1 hypothetical protein EJ05DRAFT_477655 [Pseudovirgaria hyperparasitica]